MHPLLNEFLSKEALFRHFCDLTEPNALEKAGFKSYSDMFEYIYENGCYESRFDHIPLCFATQNYINETGDSVGEVIQLEFEILKRTIEDFIEVQKQIEQQQ